MSLLTRRIVGEAPMKMEERLPEDISKIKRKPRSDSTLIKKILVILLIFLVFIVIIRYFPSDYRCLKYSLPSRPSLKGALEVNNILGKAEYLLKDLIKGPESIVVEGDTIYTGTADGRVLQIHNNKITKEIRFKDGPCGGYDLEPVCGRPLGIRRYRKDELIVMDAYLGIFTVNFAQGTFKQLLKGGLKINNEPLMFLNDLDVVNEDLIIFTDSSSRWDRRRFFSILLEAIPNGRVLTLVPSTGKVTVIMDNLFFPNGIQMLPDNESFIVAETGLARIKRHWLFGRKKGNSQIFAENLPGLPDNIRQSLQKTYWVGLAAIRRHQQTSIFDFFADQIALREILLKLIPHRYLHFLLAFKSHHAMIIELDGNGKIISSAHDLTGSVISDVSQVTDSSKYLYLGSFHANFIAVIPKQAIK